MTSPAIDSDLSPFALKRAVVYLRVSTKKQSMTDRDSDGFSLETQREVAYRKATDLGAEVVDEYIDKLTGTNSNRPALQAMQERLKARRDVDYVIVFKLDRLARKSLDDALINLDIMSAGARLVSCSEHIDDTPTGKLTHTILSGVNQFYSDNLSHELKQKMATKAKRGGTPGRAPLGYLNVRERVDGKDLGMIAVDDERAPLVTWAFEAYATGTYTVTTLTEALVAKGLTTKPGPTTGGRPVSRADIGRMLSKPYYVGLVPWGGVQYPGNHQPLVSVELFAQVQAVLESHRQGEKQRKHPHYLKSTIICARCQSRLCFGRSTGRLGTTYDYFFCLSRHQRRNDCQLPYLAVDEIEDHIATHYQSLGFTDHQQQRIRELLEAALARRVHHAEKQTVREQLSIVVDERSRSGGDGPGGGVAPLL